MNLRHVQIKTSDAARQAKSGQILAAAISYLAAQRWAGYCRSEKRFGMMETAHKGVIEQVSTIMKTSGDQIERRIAGNLNSESKYLFRLSQKQRGNNE